MQEWFEGPGKASKAGRLTGYPTELGLGWPQWGLADSVPAGLLVNEIDKIGALRTTDGAAECGWMRSEGLVRWITRGEWGRMGENGGEWADVVR